MAIAIDQNPEALFPTDVLTAVHTGRPWRVAHTKSRREKALAHYLRQSGIGYYLPMLKKLQPNQRRARFSLMPLFNGYLFFKADDFDRHHALRSNHIARIIDVVNEEKLLDELLQIYKTLSVNAPVYPYDFINEGQRVRVIKGPLKDVEGWIERKDRNFRLILSIATIMQSISVTIDADQVEPVSA